MRFMKRLLAALTLIFGLWIVPALAAPECNGAPSLTETMEVFDATETAAIVIQGDGLVAWDKAVQDNGGPVKPAEITQIVVSADEAKAVLNGETMSLPFFVFTANGCPYGSGMGSFSGELVKSALQAAFGIEDEGI